MLSLVSTLCLHYMNMLILPIELDTLSEESYKDSTLIMQLLRDNLVGDLSSDSMHLVLTCIRLSGLHPKPSQAVGRAVLRQRKPKRPATLLHLLSQKRPRSRFPLITPEATAVLLGRRES